MTKTQYRRALKQLGLTIAGGRTAKVLGISPRQSQRYAAGEPISVAGPSGCPRLKSYSIWAPRDCNTQIYQ